MHVIRKCVSAGLVVGAAVLSGCTPQTEAASPTASSDTEAASSASPSAAPDPRPALPGYDDFPESEINGDPFVIDDLWNIEIFPGTLVYTTRTGDVVTGLSTMSLTGEQIASIPVSPTPTVPPGGSTPDVNCGVTVLGVRGVWTLITSSVVEHPAEGGNPAYYEIIFQGFDRTLSPLWTSAPLGPFPTPPVCNATEQQYGGQMINGDYITRNFDNFLVIVDLVNHTLTRSDLSNLIPWGDKFLTRDDQGGYQVLDPKTLAQVSYLPSRDSGGFVDPAPTFPFDEYDAVGVFAIGDGLAMVDLDTGQATPVIQPDDPRFGEFRYVKYDREHDLIIATVADSSAEDSPRTVYVMTLDGEVKWSAPISRQCGIRDGSLVVNEQNASVVVYDLMTGERTAGPYDFECVAFGGGYVLSRGEGYSVTVTRVA